MKYESSMEKKYHADIVDTLKSAFRIDTEIPQHKNDPTPADLRDYLKNEYGKVMHGGTLSSSSRVNHYRFTASSGLTIGFNEFLTGKDNDLVLSYSQLTTFLRKNMDEVFAPDDDEEDAPSENSTYIDIILSQEEYKELTADDFLRQNDYCPYDFFDDYRAPSTTNTACTADFYESNNGVRKCESCRECWNTVCPAETEYFDDGIPAEKILKAGKEYERLVEGLEEEEQKKTDSEDDTPADNAVFDYSELDSDTADRLQVITENVARVKQQYVFGMAEQVKKAHDLLANNKTGVFGKWCKFIGISDETARRLMDVSTLCGNISDEEQAKLENLPPTLLYAVAKDDKRGNNPEAVQAVLEGDITTHKDYIALKKQLEEAKQEALNLDQDLSDTYNDYLEENEKNQKLTRKNAELEKRVNSLEIENKNLEARTLEVKEIPEEEIDRRAVELANGMLRSKDAEFTERLKEMQAENRQLKNELSKAQSGGSIEEQLTEIYEQFHDKAKYALKDCATFISEGSFTDECRKKLINRFRDFVKLLDLYFEDLNINSNVVEEYREMGEEEFL